MHLNKTQLASRINRLAALKAKIARLEAREHDLVTVIKHAGGGESSRWSADLVVVPAHVKRVPRHKQLRLTAK